MRTTYTQTRPTWATYADPTQTPEPAAVLDWGSDDRAADTTAHRWGGWNEDESQTLDDLRDLFK